MSIAAPSVRLIVATESLFEWARRASDEPALEGALRLAPGGLDEPDVLSWIERSALGVRAKVGAPSAWFIVAGDEVVGVVSFKSVVGDGAVEIGYGVAEARRGHGHATAAVALVVGEARSRGLALVAETALSNTASQRVLQRNGFERDGERVDPDEGALLRWRRAP